MKKKIVRSSGACRVFYSGSNAVVIAPRSTDPRPTSSTCGTCHNAIDLDPATLAVSRKIGFGGNAFCNVCSPAL
jgi:hypothetical protein